MIKRTGTGALAFQHLLTGLTKSELSFPGFQVTEIRLPNPFITLCHPSEGVA